MGYNLHITRANDWLESEEQPISLEEWREYVENDPELKIDPINNHRDDELMVLWFGEEGIPDDSEGIGGSGGRKGSLKRKFLICPAYEK